MGAESIKSNGPLCSDTIHGPKNQSPECQLRHERYMSLWTA